jgi:putative ABC transport system permease protein
VTAGRNDQSRPGPPPLAALLVRLFAEQDVKESIEADLAGRFERIATSDRRAAKRWYWRQALHCIAPTRTPSAGKASSFHRRGILLVLSDLFSEIGSTIRGLAKQPGFTAFTVLTLGIGIGATTSIFSVVNGVLLRPLPYPESDRLVNVWQVNEDWFDHPNPQLQDFAKSFPVSMPVLRDWSELNTVFDAVGSYSGGSFVASIGDVPVRVFGSSTTSGIWKALQVVPQLGRMLVADDDEVGALPVVVVSDGFWRNNMGADLTAIGNTLSLNGVTHTIVGITPAGFYFPDPSNDVWTSFDPESKSAGRGSQFMSSIARLKPGIPIDRAQREMEFLTERLVEEREHQPNHGVRLIPRIKEVVGDVELILLVLFSAVGLVLVIACANVANMLLVRATDRKRELAIRSALGAGRGRLLQHLILESLVIALAGGLVGVTVSFASVGMMLSAIPNVPRLEEVALDYRVLLFAVGISIVSGLLAGVLPGWKASSANASEAMTDGARGSTGGKQKLRLQSVLVCTEIALAFVLLTGAGLLVKSFVHLTSVERGFDAERVLATRIAFPQPDQPSTEEPTDPRTAAADENNRKIEFVNRLLERVRRVPGIQTAAAASNMPFMGGNNTGSTTIETPSGIVEGNVQRSSVSPGYFQVLGIPIVAGRFFGENDVAQSEPVAIVSRAMAERYWPNEDPIGWRIKSTGGDTDEPWLTVIGVIDDVRHRQLEREPYPKFYRPLSQNPPARIDVLVKAGIASPAVSSLLQDAAHEVNLRAPVPNVRVLEAEVSASVASPRFRAQLISLLAIIASLLAVMGVYAVLAYTMARRAPEIGVRMALGARRADVFRGVLARGAWLTVTGILVGGAIASGVVGILDSFLYETGTNDIAIFATAAVLVGLASMTASAVPALRATRVDPVEALRAD